MIKIISKKKYKNLLDRIDDLTLDIDYLKGENDKLEEQVKIFNDDNKKKEKTTKKQKEEIAKLKIELEDTKGFLEQEKACSNALRQEREKLRNEIDVQNNQICSLYKMFPETKKFIDDMQLLAEKYDVPEKEAKDKCIKEMKMEIKQPKKRGRKPKKVVENGK